MDPTTLAILSFVLLFALLLLGVPIAFGMGLVGFAGFAYILGAEQTVAFGIEQAFGQVGRTIVTTAQSYDLSVAPLFILMGNLVARSGLSQELYNAAYAFIGHRRGGLAMSTIVACAGFSSVCGSSVATAATMTKVAMPPMLKFGYAPSLAAGSIGAGGTLGILIPPSVPLILYGVMTQAEIGKLFIAGIVPGILGMLLYMSAIAVVTARKPELGPPGERTDARGRLRALGSIWAVALLFLFVLGGIYGGLFTATEAAGMGAAGAFVISLVRRRLTWRDLYEVLVETCRTTTMLFVILFGALVFSSFINIAGVPNDLTAWVRGLEIGPTAVILLIVLVYLVMGCFMESISMMLLTVPVFFPLIVDQGLDPIWFGIVVVVAIEISLITPPVGLNIFVLRAMLPQYPLATLFAGVGPFVVVDVIRMAIILAFPIVVLFLPNAMLR